MDVRQEQEDTFVAELDLAWLKHVRSPPYRPCPREFPGHCLSRARPLSGLPARVEGHTVGRRMKRDTLATATLVLGLVLGIGYIAAGVIGWIADVDDGDASDLAFWLILLCGGGAMLLAGMFLARSPAWLSTALVCVGALAGALALFWSVIVPILAIALVVLVVRRTRREAIPA